MAEVKLKNGYLKISNSLFDNLYFRNFTKRELIIISLIIRMSYGFNHKTAIIKPKTWFSVCGLYKQDVNKALADLKEKGVIRDLGNNTYSLNKNYDEWLVNYPKNFDMQKFNILKMLQQDRAQNTYEKVSETLTKEEVKNLPENKQNTNKKESKILTVSKTLTETEVKHLPENNNETQNTYEKVSETLTKEEVKNLPGNGEEASGVNNTDPIKDNKDNKDIIHNIYNGKKFDPYFNNPVVDTFKKEYENNLKTSRCYLDNLQINKLVEISIDNPDFISNIPKILNKYSRIEFSNGISKFGLRGLINEGKWAAILNGEYDAYLRPDESDENNGDFDLGIPTCEVAK